MWIFGHSYIQRAARLFRGPPTSGSGRDGLAVHWFGVGGMRLHQLRGAIVAAQAKGKAPPPDLIVVHLGGNDFASVGRKGVREQLMADLEWIAQRFPNTVVAWSQMIPRMDWRTEGNRRAINRSVWKMNGEFTRLTEGNTRIRTIHHGNIKGAVMFHRDGVHLSKTGMELFIGNIMDFAQTLF